jgi:hypothetical protein
MLKRLSLASVLLLPVAAQATPLNESITLRLIGSSMRACMADKTAIELWPQFKDRTNLCGCKATLETNLLTLEDLYYIDSLAPDQQIPTEINKRVFEPALEYCGYKYPAKIPR